MRFGGLTTTYGCPPNLTSSGYATRDSHEHWDNPTSPARWASLDADSHFEAHEWDPQGKGVLGGLVADEDLRRWAVAVYDDLVSWTPWRRL